MNQPSSRTLSNEPWQRPQIEGSPLLLDGLVLELHARAALPSHVETFDGIHDGSDNPHLGEPAASPSSVSLSKCPHNRSQGESWAVRRIED